MQISNFVEVNALLHPKVNCLKVLGGKGVGKQGGGLNNIQEILHSDGLKSYREAYIYL